MQFTDSKPIYTQIAELIIESIAKGEMKAGEKIQSVREMAGIVQVNPNTVARSYTELQTDGIIEQKRGIGFFVADDARKHILKQKQDVFRSETLPRLFEEMKLLEITPEYLSTLYSNYLNTSN